MREQFNYGLIKVSVYMPKRINIVRGDSGVGKTFLAKALHQLTLKSYKVISYGYENYMGISCDQIASLNDDSLLILDNADIYMTKELQRAVLQSHATCLIFVRDTTFFNSTNAALCKVVYKDKTLTLRELRYEDNF